MKRAGRLLCMLAILMMLACAAAGAETKLFDPVAVVAYDRTLMIDWTPSYNLNMPGVLLELAHSEGMLSISAIEGEGLTPSGYLSDRLDRAGETLSVSNALLSKWESEAEQDEYLLSYSYTYPDGDEIHLFRSWVSSMDDMLIDLTIDTWGEEAESLMDAALQVFVEGGLKLKVYENAVEIYGTLSDVVEDEAETVSVQVIEQEDEFRSGSFFYPLSDEAVILFPNPDDPSLHYPVAPDMISLVDAILTYEESSDSPAVFHTILENGVIVYMEYGLMQ